MVLAHDLERIGHVLVDGLVGQQLEVLEDAADVAPQQRHLGVPQRLQVATRDQDAALRRLELLEDELHERRLARPGGSDQEDELALLDVEGDVAEADDVDLAFIRLADVLEHDHGRADSRLLLLGAC